MLPTHKSNPIIWLYNKHNSHSGILHNEYHPFWYLKYIFMLIFSVKYWIHDCYLQTVFSYCSKRPESWLWTLQMSLYVKPLPHTAACVTALQPLRFSAHICVDIICLFCRIHFTVTSVQRRRIKGKNPNAYTTFCQVLIYCYWCNIRGEQHILFQWDHGWHWKHALSDEK